MDATQIFRQGLGTVAPRQQAFDQFHGQGIDDDDFLDGDSSGQRVAHTLTACCRCRQVILEPICFPRLIYLQVLTHLT